MSDLNDFLKLVAEAKTNTPSSRVKKIEEQVKTNVKSDLSSLFEQLSSVRTPQERLAAGEPVSISELPEIQAEIKQAIESGEVELQGGLNEAVLPTPIGKVPDEAQIPDLDKYLKPKSDLPKEEPLVNEFRQVNDKIKFLERWVSQIQNAGPGSGEVNFRYLDDVNRLTMGDSNNNWVLEYDIATKKVQFTENIGPIRTVKFNTNGYQTPLAPGEMGWNSREDCLDIAQADGSTLQAGLEHYFQIHNSTGSTLLNGEVVMFSGVDEDDHTNPIPEVMRYVANSSAVPLYIVGVMTNDVPSGSHGRATVFGKIRNLNTTGASVNETWVKGDLLWAHPTMPGKLTKLRPTAPDVASSIAAVIQVSATDGVLLVRPTIFPRLYFARFRDTTNQNNPVTNTPRQITFNETKISSGFHLDTTHASRVVAENSGLYKFDVRLQFTSSNSSTAKIWTWYRVDGVDGEGTATQYTIQSNGATVVTNLPYIVSLQAGQYFEVMWASDSTHVSLYAPPSTSFCPAIPSAVIALTQVNL